MKKVCINLRSDKTRDLVCKYLMDTNIVFLPDLDDTRILEELSSTDVLLTQFLSPNEFSPLQWEAIKKISVIQTVSAGVDQVPFERLGSDTTLFSNAGGWAAPIAEHVLAMALCCSRKLLVQTEDLKTGHFRFLSYSLRSLRRKTALIVGYGGIGSASADLFRGLGMKIHALCRSSTPQGVDKVWSMNQIEVALEEADLVLLALPLTNETLGLFDHRLLEAMKEDAILINVARAAIVDEKDLYMHLKEHPHFYAALDVWWDEPRSGGPFATNYPFFDLPNVIGTSHNSNQSEYALQEALIYALKNINSFIHGGHIRGYVDVSLYH